MNLTDAEEFGFGFWDWVWALVLHFPINASGKYLCSCQGKNKL